MLEADLKADLALLQTAAEAATDIAMGHFGGDYQTWQKDGGAGPVTEADLAIDAMLKSTLTAARPAYGWLSEETEDDTARLACAHCFIIDPIDGTRAFAAGERNWGHSLAIAHRGQVQTACIAMPALGRTFTAIKGGGARDDKGPLQVSAQTDMAQTHILSTRANTKAHYWPRGLPPFTRHHRSSLAYRMALIAAGEFEAMLTFRPTWEWDIAAGALMVEEAGGRATDQSGGPLKFNSPSAQTEGVIAGGAIHEAILRART